MNFQGKENRMTLLETIQTGKDPKPRRVLLYGLAGIGKTTWGSMAEKPIFIQTEDGTGDVGADRFPMATSFDDVMQQLATLYTAEHDYKTVVIDSLDHLERLIFADVCQKRGVDSIEDIGYAKGYVFALAQWRRVLEGLDALRNDRGMEVILIAHATIEKFADPENEAYDRYAPKLHKHASPLVQEWCDEVLFATHKVHTTKTDEGFNKTRTRGVGASERVVRTTYRPAHVAKNRLNLPDELPLDYRVFATYARGDVPGEIVDKQQGAQE